MNKTEFKALMAAVQVEDPWRACQGIRITRSSPTAGREVLDPGVNFFVLMLEHLGATTTYSCEGHPRGFYVAFRAGYELALRINSCGFFTVEIMGDSYWAIRWAIRCAETTGTSRKWGEAARVQHHTWAAQAWARNFKLTFPA